MTDRDDHPSDSSADPRDEQIDHDAILARRALLIASALGSLSACGHPTRADYPIEWHAGQQTVPAAATAPRGSGSESARSWPPSADRPDGAAPASATPPAPSPPQVVFMPCLSIMPIAATIPPFAENSTALAPAASASLDRLASELAAHPEIRRVELSGNVDAREAGRPHGRIDLALARANAVRDALVARGVDPARLTPVSAGALRPIAPNTTAAGRAHNRRVELRIVDRQP